MSRSNAVLGPHSVKEGPNTIVHSVCEGRGGGYNLVTKRILVEEIDISVLRELGDLRRIHRPAPTTASLEVVDAATQVIDHKHRCIAASDQFSKTNRCSL